MFNRHKIKPFIILALIFVSFLALANDFDKQRPAGVDDKQWSSLKSAVQEAKLLPTPEGIGGTSDRFGYSVALDGERALVGATGIISDMGAVFVYDFNGSSWHQTAILQPSDGLLRYQFGCSVSLSGNHALVGSCSKHIGHPYGSAYLYEFDGKNWTESAKFTPNDGPDVSFGISLSISGNHIVMVKFLRTLF